MDFFTAPFYSCFSVDFYRRVIRAGVAKAFLYLFFLSFLATTVGFLAFTKRVLPQINEFVEWAKVEMPPMTLGPEGISVYVKMPYTLTHPRFGPVVTFDTAQANVTVEMMGDVPVFVTANRLYIHQAGGELRVYDVAQLMGGVKAEQGAIKIEAQTIQALYDITRPWMIFIGLVFFFLFTYSWKLLAAVFYSWFGLLINFSRKPKLGYGAIFNVATFALTPWFLIQLLGLLVSPVGRIPFSFFIGFLVTSFFLYLGIKQTEDRPAAKATSS